MADQNAPEPTPGLDTLSDSQLDSFFLSGELPTDAPSDHAPAEKTEEAAASKPVDQAASTDAVAEAATAAAKSEKVKPAGSKKSAAERAEEIERATVADEERLRKALAKRRETREALEEAEREPASKKAASNEAPATSEKEPAWKKYRNMPGAPKFEDFEKLGSEDALESFIEAKADFIASQIAEEKFNAMYGQRSEQERESYQRDQAFVETATRASERLAAEIEADPGLLDRVDPRWKALNPSDRLAEGETMTVAHFVKDQVTFKSNHPGKLSAWLTENDSAELKRIGQLSPEQIIREIAIKDHSFGALDADTPDEAAGERPHPRVSKAPAPSPTLGKKATPGRDPLKPPDSFDGFDDWNAAKTKAESGRRNA